VVGLDFVHTVVLLVEHASQGSMGLVVNRATSRSVDAALDLKEGAPGLDLRYRTDRPAAGRGPHAGGPKGHAVTERMERFQAATEASKRFATRPDNDTLLALYALYKQATSGDATGPGPGPFDFVGRAKFDAWTRLKGVSADDAMRQYAELVDELSK
jgi:acyl-CoA-binding protein